MKLPFEFKKNQNSFQQGVDVDDPVGADAALQQNGYDDQSIRGLSDLYCPEESTDSNLHDIVDVLYDTGNLTSEQHSQIRQQQSLKPDDNVEQLLLEAGLCDTDQILTAKAKMYGLEFRHISPEQVDKTAFEQLGIELSFIKANSICPIAIENGKLIAGTSEPENIFAIEDLKRQTPMEVQLVVCSSEDIDAFYDTLKEDIIDYNVDDIISDMTDVEVVEDQQKDFDDIEKMAGQSPIIKFVNYLISSAINEGASDIHIEPKDKHSRVRYRIDGVLFDTMQSPAKMHPAVVSRIKIMSNLDISERRLPQDGKISVIVGGRAIDLRISILPTNRGEKVVIRILDSKSVMKGLEHLGMESSIQQSFQEQIALPNGIFLVTGPTGSGKSTTLYSALCQMDGDKLNISTVEDPVEYELDFCNQVQVNEKIGLDFASALRSLLRQDPDIIMIGEIRDQETARIAVQAALTGHLVFSTLHTNDAASSITRLVDIGIDTYLIAASLNGILAQRLVRRICPECKEPYKVSESMRKYVAEVGIGTDELFQGKGCDNCRGSGYVGRIGIYEMLVVDDVFRDMINKDASVSNMRKVFRQGNHLNLFDDGIIKVRRGLTTIEEVLRVTEMQSKDQNDTPKESSALPTMQSVSMNVEYEADESKEAEPSEQPEEIQSEPVSVTLEKWEHIEGCRGASQYGEEHAWVKEAVSDDFVFTLRARLNEGQGYGIWFRADPERLDGYCFQYDTSHNGGSLVLNKWENFNQQTLASVPWDKSWYGQMCEIEIRAVGADISVIVDGQEIINLTDKQYRSGRIGFRLWDWSKADFEDMSLAAV